MIDLKKFCTTQPGRYSISEPFSCGDGWDGATDGRFAVRVKSESKDRTFNTPDFSKVFPNSAIMDSPSEMLSKSLFKAADRDNPDNLDSRLSGMTQCPWCIGIGFEAEMCKKCEGTGEFGDECEHCGCFPSCPACNKVGFVKLNNKPCGCCDNGVRFDLIKFGNKDCDGSRVAYMLKYIPNLEVIPASFGKGPIAFKTPDGLVQALLQPFVDKTK